MINSEIIISSKEIFLIGDNGQGKSNFIEGIYLSCFGSSFRTHLNNRLITDNKNDASVITIYNNYIETDLEISVKLRKNRKKEIYYDNKRLKDRKELLFNMPCIVFSHDDMEYITGTPKKRRLFFSQTMALTDPSFLSIYRNYNKILKNRNIILKTANYSLLGLYNKKLSEFGFEIYVKIRDTLKAFNETFSPVFSKVFGTEDNFSIVYKPNWGDIGSSGDALGKIERNTEKDKIYKVSTSGPHRDEFIFSINNRNFSTFASTGQIRLVALILKLSQSIYFSEVTGKKPVLLLDDVLLELDPKKKISFINNLPEYDQAFYTFLSDEDYIKFKKNTTSVLKVINGRIEN